MGLSSIVGQIIALEDIPPFQDMITGFSLFFFWTSAAFVFNDYMDAEIDKINVPGRPIPAGLISRRSALYFGVLLSLIGILFLSLMPLKAVMAALAAASVFFLYTPVGKRSGLPGNMMVAFCVSVPPVCGALMVGSINIIIVAVFLLTFLSSTGREITQGIADMKGDRMGKVKSLALVHGPRAAAVIASLFFALTALVGPLLFVIVFEGTNSPLILLILLAEIGFFYSSVILLRNPGKDVALHVCSQVTMWMVTGLVVFFAVGISS